MSRPTPRRAAPSTMTASAASAAIYKPNRKSNPHTDKRSIAKWWQIEAYRHVNICGEARYAATLFAATASRAEMGVSEPQTLAGRTSWVTSGPEVDAFNELAPTVRERVRLIRDFMLHYVIAGECYLIARDRQDIDPGFEETPNEPIWEIVAVTELRKIGEMWSVKHDNGNYIELNAHDPVIRMWNPDPEDRREAWSPFRSLLPTLREIEWLTKHIFTQVRSRLMSAGVWFLPDNLTFPPPPPEAVEGGEATIATMNEAEQFMVSLAASSMGLLEDEEVAFPSVVMAEAAALANIDQSKLIQFWSEIDDKAMVLRSDAIRRFALGMDLPPEQVLGTAGLQGGGSGGRTSGTVNHWGMWANEEQTISDHIEPALDTFVSILTSAFLRSVVEGTDKVIAYNTASLRLRQDRSKEALEWYDRGVLKAEVALRETGFDPATDKMDDDEHRIWILNKIVSGSATPEQLQAAFMLLTGKELPVQEPVSGNAPSDRPAPELPGRNQPPSLDDHPYEGPPRVQHDQTEAPYSASVAADEVLVLRALEKAGNVLLNSGKRGRDRDRTTPPHMAHVLASIDEVPKFDFSLAATVYSDLSAVQRAEKERQLANLCTDLYRNGQPYTREALIEAVKGV